MSVLTFRGVRYERGSLLSTSEAPVQQLVYRSPAQEERVIRSAPTAALLQLEDPTVTPASSTAVSRFVLFRPSGSTVLRFSGAASCAPA